MIRDPSPSLCDKLWDSSPRNLTSLSCPVVRSAECCFYYYRKARSQNKSVRYYFNIIMGDCGEFDETFEELFGNDDSTDVYLPSLSENSDSSETVGLSQKIKRKIRKTALRNNLNKRLSTSTNSRNDVPVAPLTTSAKVTISKNSPSPLSPLPGQSQDKECVAGAITVEERLAKKNVRKVTPNPSQWKSNVQKMRHQAGQSYVNRRGKFVPEKRVKTKKNCLSSCRYQCAKRISKEERKEIFNSYYSLSMNEKKHFLIANTERCLTTRPKIARKNKPSRRTFSFKYFFHIKGEKLQICKYFFLGTLDISQKPVYQVHSNKNSQTNTPEQDKRGKSNGSRRKPQGDVELAKEHIKSFPLVESHYCRKDTKRGYLGSNLSVSKMYNDLYLKRCEELKVEPVKESMYRHIFVSEFNLGFQRPKKDRCDLCEKYKIAEKTSTLTEELTAEYEKHQILKVAMREERKRDKESEKPVLLFDLQNVITCPHAEISCFFYYRKLNLYNLTAYYSITKKVYCAIWPETLAGRSGSDIASALRKILDKVVEENDITELVTWSDSCVPQNRNSIMANAIMDFQRDNPSMQTITMKYSVPGHSCVQEVDNAHSQIDRAMENEEFYSPLGFVRLLKKVNRRNPFAIIQMLPSDFKDYATTAKLLNYKIVPFASIASVTFTQTLHEVSFKLNHKQEEPSHWVNLKFTEKPSRRMSMAIMFPSAQRKSVLDIRPKVEKKENYFPEAKKKDMKLMLPFMPLVDRDYYKALLNT